MKKKLLRILFLAGLIFASGLYWLTLPKQLPASALPEHTADTTNGELVFYASGCASCHAAPDSEGAAKLILAGGLQLKTDFGVFVVPNISPDRVAGIGAWDTAAFVTAMVEGTSPDGQHYFPAFPYASYTRMEMRDIIDLKAFLDTLPASGASPPDHDLAFPFSIRQGVGLWKLMFLSGDWVVEAGDDPLRRRGRELVEGAGHCSECHTPRNLAGGLDKTHWMGGGPNPDGKGRIPNITPHADGLAAWSAEEIAYYLETGFTPEFDSAGGAMVAVIANTSQLPPEDRSAIAAYLKALPPVANPVATAE